MSRKILLIGLDSAPPELLFDRFQDDLPNIRSLIQSGVHGDLNSTVPPITVPAWMSMMTGKDPGELGCYGLRNRAARSYGPMAVASSRLVKEALLWDILGAAGKRVVLVGVPQTYPPRPVNGWLISSFLAPDTGCDYTYPADLKREIERVSGGYILDVPNFRTEDRAALLRQIHEMTERRFRVTRHLMQTRPWDFLMHVEIGTDRIHHAFWRFLDETHRRHEPDSEFRDAIRDYYRLIDREIGRLMALAGDETAVLLVSDHGAKRIDGGICVNEWLLREGYLALESTPREPSSLEAAGVDWDRTAAWGEGGYYARIFLNVKGREPRGTVPPGGAFEALRDELSRKLAAIPDESGREIATQVFKPQDVYQTCNGIPPDLIVYFGDLFWRSVGTVGGGEIHTLRNDTGPDDANHAQNGVLIARAEGLESGRKLDGLDILDVAPTILSLMDVPLPGGLRGRSILEAAEAERGSPRHGGPAAAGEVYSEAERAVVEERLRALGYL